VIKNIPDNSKVMGYPAKNIRDFLKDNEWYIKQQL
jgi:UDP-3-O-[3-hydroxymyristoyl] glucosamine N-acyltransferase